MTTGQSQNAINVHVADGESLSVTFDGARGTLFVNGQEYSFNGNVIVPANVANDQNSAGGLVQRVLEVGQRLRDGTVVLSVDLDKNEALFVPAEIFGGRARFDNQNDVVASVNRDALHGHNDWRRITDDEGKTLADNWARVTTHDPEWFWLASSVSNYSGRVRHGGRSDWRRLDRGYSYPVPVVRCGLARNLDI